MDDWGEIKLHKIEIGDDFWSIFDEIVDDDSSFINSRNKILNGVLELLDDGSYTITCPYTGSRNVYQIDSSTYASFETDQPFKIVFNLADLKPDFN